MSRVLFATWPFDGHLLPQLSIARAFAERGHGVAFYSGEAARASVEQAGFELFAFERVDEQRVFQTLHEIDGGGRRGRPGRGRLLGLMRYWLVETMPGQVEDLRQVLARWPADAICTDIALWGPTLVLWEAQPIPVAMCAAVMGAAIPGPDAPPLGFGMRPPRTRLGRLGSAAITRLTELLALPVRRAVNEVRASYGLPALRESVNRFAGRLPLYIVGNVREFDYNRRDLPASVHYVGNCIWYPRRAGGGQPLETIPTRRPWVHVTESTLAGDEPFLLRAAIDALAQEPVEVIVTTGERREASVLGDAPLPANVHVARWLNHGELLPRCAALVTLGGKSTVLAAAEAGVPMVLVPTSWEKPDNARRVTEAGAGIRLSARRLRPKTLRAAVREVIAEPRYREAAQRLAGELAAAPGPARAAELLEELAAGARGRRHLATAVGGRVSALASPSLTDPRDLFAAAKPGQAPRRPRLLSYVGRWGRARRWLPSDALRVLDIGCAGGYGSVAIVARAREPRLIVGVERDPELLQRAQRHFPWLPILDADGSELPLADSCADAVLLLDVIEHDAEPERVLTEAHRVLRPGGTIIVSVPHRGPTRHLDAVNVYAAMRRRRPSWPELEGVVGTDEEEHRHFATEELAGLLEPQFTVERIARTGVGLQELVTLAILAVRVPLHAPRASRVLMPLHLIAYIFDDLLPTGRFAYHIAMRGRSNKPAETASAVEGSAAAAAGAQANGTGTPDAREAIERNMS